MDQDLRIDDLYNRALSRWTWILGLAVLGAVLGWGVSRLRPPLYMGEASAVIGIDYGRTQEMSDRAEREAFLEVQSLVLSDATFRAALHQVPPDPINPTSVTGYRSMVRLERFDPKWDFQVFSSNRDQAARLANAWAQAALDGLGEAQRHALRAADLQAQMFQAGCSLVPGTSPDLQPKWQCENQDPSISAEDALSGVMKEAALSRGILPALTFSLQDEAVPPEKSVIYGRGQVILGGLILGWIVGLSLALAIGEGQILPRRRHDG
jgi:hypothetical protein